MRWSKSTSGGFPSWDRQRTVWFDLLLGNYHVEFPFLMKARPHIPKSSYVVKAGSPENKIAHCEIQIKPLRVKTGQRPAAGVVSQFEFIGP